MQTVNDFQSKHRKYIPDFPKASGKPTIYIEGYPYEDDEPMAATGFHGEQISNLSDQLIRYFSVAPHIYVGIDSFIYYREGDITKNLAPDIYVVFGVDKYPQRRSFYTWSEGAAPTAIFEFLSDSTAHQDRKEKVDIYLGDMGAEEYFIHQPDMERPVEFRGWRRTAAGGIVEIVVDAEGGLFSESLNLHLRWRVDLQSRVRLLRPYLPDGTPIMTSMEEQHLRMEEQHLRIEEQHLRIEEQHLRIEEQQLREEAERRTAEEAQRRKEVETELERLRAQLANRQNNTP